MKGEIQDIPQQEKENQRKWIFFMVQGGVAALAGLILLIWPKLGLTVAAFVLGLFLVVDGIQRIIVSFVYSEKGRTDAFVLLLLRGILQIILGAFIVTRPAGAGRFGAVFMLTVMGILLMAGSLWEIFRHRDALAESRSQRTSALFILVLGAFLVALPILSITFLLRVIGLFSLLGGAYIVYLSFKLRKGIIK